MGGVDLSWLAGGLTSALVYSLLGPVAAAKYDQVAAAQGAEAPRVTA
jgi:toxin CptA